MMVGFVLFVLAVVAAEATPVMKKRHPMFNPDLFEGDMLNAPSGDRSAIPRDSQRWKNGVIPYFIYETSKNYTTVIEAGLDYITKRTCLRFVPRTNEKDYIFFDRGEGCYSYVGRIGGPQILSLGEGCDDRGIVVHEMLHAIGFMHEHNRNDRDDYLTIYWDNIDPEYLGVYNKNEPSDERLLTPFDYDSIMMYGSIGFGKEDDLITMEGKDGRFLEGGRQEMSKDDIERVKILYKC